jgi:hypothetical protein
VAEQQEQSEDQAQQAASVLPSIQVLRRAGWSLRRIADHFQSQGVPSPTRWKGKPTRWTARGVKRLLDLAGAEENPSSSDLEGQQMTFTGPITLVATGPLRFEGTVTMNGPSTGAAADEEPPKESTVEFPDALACEVPHD